MKYLPVFTAFLLGIASSYGQDKKPDDKSKVQVTASQEAFLNLPAERRQEFAKHYMEANRLYQDKRIFETFAELDKAEAIFKDGAEVHNLRGSCHVEFRSFDKAMECFEKADSLAPNNPSVLFNVAEVYFVTHKWKEARERFVSVQKIIPDQMIALRRLVEFKILLCTMHTGPEAEIQGMVDKYDFLDDSPYYYYAQAALAYHKGDVVKAEEWLGIVGRIFQSNEILSPWQDTLIEFGYIKSFYGGDLGTEP